MNNVFPTSYHQEVVSIKTVSIFSADVTSYDDAVRNYAPNFKHKDGKIYASRNGEKYWVSTVSPYHPLFRTQIEDGVWPLVDSLLKKNYLTVSSCEGHFFDNKLTVTVVFENIDDANVFVKSCNSVLGWRYKISDSERTIYETVKSNKTVYTEKKTVSLDKNFEEFKRYNLLFFKNYETYVYVDIYVFKYPKNIFKRFIYKYILRRPHAEFFVSKQLMLDHINSNLEKYYK